MAIIKEMSFDKPAEEIFASLKKALMESPKLPVDVKNKMTWNEINKTGEIEFQGVLGNFEVNGSNPCLLKINISIGLPASLFIGESEISKAIDQICTNLAK